MKKFSCLLTLLVLLGCLTWTACSKKSGDSEGPSADKEGPSADKEVPSAVSVSIGLKEHQNINSSNASNFPIQGECSEEGQKVIVNISIRDFSLSTQSDCSSGKWETALDVTRLNKTSDLITITVSHSSTDGRNAPPTSASVTNEFLCPENFLGVPALKEYTTNAFCVAKYEMKDDGSGNTVSQASGIPYSTGIDTSNRATKCQAMGDQTSGDSKYDLISNNEWQALARNIELVPSNWEGGIVGSGKINRGRSVPIFNQPPGYLGNLAPASEDDNEACLHTGATCNDGSWNFHKRTHTLSNGEIIWDLAGNVMEVIDRYEPPRPSSTEYDLAPSSQISQITGVTKDLFGPSGNYTSLSQSPYGGLGYMHLQGDGLSNKDVKQLVRGGHWAIIGVEPYTEGGIFSVFLRSSPLSRTAKGFGFRCVYHP